MQRIYQKDGNAYSSDSWFIAKITEVGPTPTATCESIPYGWQKLDYCSTGQGTEIVGEPDNYGTTTLRPAYCIDTSQTAAVDAVVMMRFRGVFNGLPVYEFFQTGAGGSSSTGCFGVKAVQCTNGMLVVTYSDAGGCVGGSCVGAALYELGTKTTIANNTPVGINVDDLNLIYGDLGDMGLVLDNGKFKNDSGGVLNLKVSLQYCWSPVGTSGSTKAAYIVRNEDATDTPVSNFVASSNNYTFQLASNLFKIDSNIYFQAFAWQNSGGDGYLGDPAINGKTTIMIERYC